MNYNNINFINNNMEIKNKNRIIGKISLTSSNINTTKINQNKYANSNNNLFSSLLQSKVINHHKRANSFFKMKDLSLNNNSNKNTSINQNNIISNLTNSTSYNCLKLKRTTLSNNNINLNINSNKNNINYQKNLHCQTTITTNNNTNNFQEFRSLSPTFSHYKKLLPKKTSNKKTLVLDLDETLVHSCFFPFDCPSDLIIQIEQDKNIQDIHVLVRPYVEEFLERMSKKYELVLFTASISNYANPLLNFIDKNGYVPFRLFREHCTLINTAFVKDLTRLGRNLKDIIILDNNPLAYSLNQYNGFPITSWFEDKNDDELLKIAPILEFLSYVPDVREYIKKIVCDNKVQFNIVKSVISNYNKELKRKKINFEFDSFVKTIKNDLTLHKSKSTKINLFIKPINNMAPKFKMKNIKRNNINYNNSKELTQPNLRINNNKTTDTLNNNLDLSKINIQNIPLNHINYSLSHDNTKRKNNIDLKLHKIIKRKKGTNLNTIRNNLSSRKVSKIINNKDSTFNLDNISSTNGNINTNVNNQGKFKLSINLKLNRKKYYNINRKFSTNTSFVKNKIITHISDKSKENSIIKINNTNTHLRLNKSLKPFKKIYKSNINSISNQKYNISRGTEKILTRGINDRTIFFNNNQNGNVKDIKNKNNAKFIRTIFKNKNIILSHSQKLE